MIKLYVRDVSYLRDGSWKDFLRYLPVERRQLVRRLRRDQDRARSVGAWCLLREALAREGVDIDGRTPEKGPYGKPCFEACPEFSISHAGSYAAVAVSDNPVGVDIEEARCTMRIVRHFFSEAEVSAAEALDEEAQRLYLQRIWVAKEAFVKAIGTGLTTPFDSFRIELDGESAGLVQDLSPLPLRITEFSEGACRIAVVGVGQAVRIDEGAEQ